MLIRMSAVLFVLFAVSVAHAQQQVTEPVYRVAARPAPQVLAQTVANPDMPFDLAARPGEHPLAPCHRVATAALKSIDDNIADYSATMYKQELIDGQLGATQAMQMRLAHEPFSVYLKFVKPFAGREVLYVDGQNNNKLVALSDGWKRRFGKVYLDPNGSMAMDGQRHPITSIGIRNLTAKLLKVIEGDMKYAECEVKVYPKAEVAKRMTTMIESTHPHPRSVFKYHKARIYIDNEYKIPTAFEAYTWPAQPGGQPQLLEKYIYTDLKLNNGYTADDFSADNPNIFK